MARFSRISAEQLETDQIMQDFDIADLATQWVREAGRRALRLRNSLGLTTDPVRSQIEWHARMDIEIERWLKRRIRASFPDHFLYGDDGFSVCSSRPTWVVAPLGGGVNFARAYPMWAISLALVIEQQPRLAAVFDPFRQEVCTAWLGGGSWCGTNRLKAVFCDDPGKALIATTLPKTESPSAQVYFRELTAIQSRYGSIRVSGCVPLDLVQLASGRIDGFWARDMEISDLMAGLLLVTEAGGRGFGRDGRSAGFSSAPTVGGPGLLEVLLADLDGASRFTSAGGPRAFNDGGLPNLQTAH